MSKLNLIAIVAIVAAFAVSAFVGAQVFAQQNVSNAGMANANVSTMGAGLNGTSGMDNNTLSMPAGMTSSSSSPSASSSAPYAASP
jgi:hypothetical protein